MAKDYIVTVCANCLCASCWQGEFYCERYKAAKTVDMKASELRKLKREHRDWYSVRRLVEMTGYPPVRA